jgi:hypothetical protein
MSTAPRPPRLVGLFRDLYDDNGTVVGWEVVAWGAKLDNGQAVTIPVAGPTSATVWHSLDDACRAYEAQIAEVRPLPYPQWWRGQR